MSLELRDRAATDSRFLRNVITVDESGSMIMILRRGLRVLNVNHPAVLVRKKRVNQDPT